LPAVAGALKAQAPPSPAARVSALTGQDPLREVAAPTEGSTIRTLSRERAGRARF